MWAQRRELLAAFVNAAAEQEAGVTLPCLCQKKEGTVFFCPFLQAF